MRFSSRLPQKKSLTADKLLGKSLVIDTRISGMRFRVVCSVHSLGASLGASWKLVGYLIAKRTFHHPRLLNVSRVAS